MFAILQSIFADDWCRKNVAESFHSRMDSSSRFPDGHPDANLLSAFAENALLRDERDAVTAHLSECAECRECVALAFEQEPVLAPPKAVRTRFVFASLAAAAAGACVLVSIWLMHTPQQNRYEVAAVPPPTHATVQEPPAPVPQKPSVPVQPKSSAPKHTQRRVRVLPPPPAVTVPPQAVAETTQADKGTPQTVIEPAPALPRANITRAASSSFVAGQQKMMRMAAA